ncbi:MAG: ABC transporter permease [Acidobacteria bacterium]|nr:ABC transporter permease [Acidobacteriota bacterium]
MAIRVGMLWEILRIALDTLRANKLRSALTILGVVIGVMSVVAMTALITGFSNSLESQIRAFGSNTVFIQKLGFQSFSSGRDFLEVMKRPNLTTDDARALADSPLVKEVGLQFGGGGPFAAMERMSFAGQATRQFPVIGATANYGEMNYIPFLAGRFFGDFEVRNRRNVIVLGYSPAESLFLTRGIDPIGKLIRIGRDNYTVVGVMDKRPGALGDANGFAVIPWTTYEKHYPSPRFRGILFRPLTIVVAAVDGVGVDDLRTEIESIMRARHRLKLGEENDFDTVTADFIVNFLRQFTQAVVLALFVISSIALMVGGIGVMAIMTISVTERTREIGVRKALGARRREILVQFLIEAVFLTMLGGLIGILLGAGIGYAVNVFAGFPVALPIWSFVIGVGFSATVGILFGMLPAVKAAKLDPIEALRYE